MSEINVKRLGCRKTLYTNNIIIIGHLIEDAPKIRHSCYKTSNQIYEEKKKWFYRTMDNQCQEIL